jgi:integrase
MLYEFNLVSSASESLSRLEYCRRAKDSQFASTCPPNRDQKSSAAMTIRPANSKFPLASGDTKTEKSRRTLELPAQAAEALREHRARQAKERLAAGPLWKDHGLVFASQAGTPLDVSHVRRAFKAITKKAGLGENWTPRELRHSFVSIMSDNGVSIETISDLVGHAGTAVTEEVYRHQLKPVITKGAETMNTIFNQHNQAKSA